MVDTSRMRQHWIAIHFKNRLLLAVMKHLAGNAEISFEGDLSSLGLHVLLGASTKETEILRRNTSWPRQGYVVVPLTPDTIQPIFRAIGGTIPQGIIHIQIAKEGKLEFGAYDRFHPDTLTFGEVFSKDFLDDLVSQGILEPKPASAHI
jgi:hypothetical protein